MTCSHSLFQKSTKGKHFINLIVLDVISRTHDDDQKLSDSITCHFDTRNCHSGFTQKIIDSYLLK